MAESGIMDEGWRLACPDGTQEWALASGPGWISEADAQRGTQLEERLRRLEERAETLESEIASARDAGFAEGLQSARGQVWTVISELTAERGRLAEVAAAVACELATALVGRAVATNDAARDEWVRQALSPMIAADSVERVEVPEPLTDAISALLHPVRVVGAADLGQAAQRAFGQGPPAHHGRGEAPGLSHFRDWAA